MESLIDRLSEWKFEYGTWLQALFLLPLIVLFYLLRRRAERTLVPHLPLWDVVFDRLRRKRSWSRVLLSILLQMAILAVLIVCVAGPYRERRQRIPGHSILVLDGRLGVMQIGEDGRPLEAAIRQTARRLIPSLLEEGTVSMAVAGESLFVLGLPSRDGQALEALLEESLQAKGDGAPREVLMLAADCEATARVLWITPFRFPEGMDEPTPTLRLAVIAVPGGVVDAGIASVDRASPDVLLVRVAGGGSSRRVLLLEGGKVLAAATVSPTDAGASVSIEIPRTAGPSLSVQLDPVDAFDLNDRVELSLAERMKPSVLIVSDQKSTPLDALLEAFTASGDVLDASRSARASSAELGQAAKDYDVVILAGIQSDLPLPEGRYLLLGASAPDLPFEVVSSSAAASEIVERVEGDPLIRGLDLKDWVFEQVVPVRAKPGYEVIVRGSNGPLLGRGRTPSTRFIHIGVPPDDAASTLPVSETFPVLIAAARRELAGRSGWPSPLTHRIGGVFVPETESASRTTEVSATDGQLWTLPRSDDGTGFVLPGVPGRYRARGSGTDLEVTTAVLDHPGAPKIPPPPATVYPEIPEEARKTSDRPLLCALLIALLLIEWLLYSWLVTD